MTTYPPSDDRPLNIKRAELARGPLCGFRWRLVPALHCTVMSDSAVPVQVSTAGIPWPQVFEPQERGREGGGESKCVCVCQHRCVCESKRATVRVSLPLLCCNDQWARLAEVWVFQLGRKRNARLCKIWSALRIVTILLWAWVNLYHYVLRMVIQVLFLPHLPPCHVDACITEIFISSPATLSGFLVMRIFTDQQNRITSFVSYNMLFCMVAKIQNTKYH